MFFRYSFDVFREQCDFSNWCSVFVERWFRPGSELRSPWGMELVWRQAFPLWAPHRFGNFWLSGILGSRSRFHRKSAAVQSSMFAPQSYSESFKELLVSYLLYLENKIPRDFVEMTSWTALFSPKMSSLRCWWPLWIWCFNTQLIIRSQIGRTCALWLGSIRQSTSPWGFGTCTSQDAGWFDHRESLGTCADFNTSKNDCQNSKRDCPEQSERSVGWFSLELKS